MFETRTEEDGRFVLAVPAGVWKLRIEAPGFRGFEVDEIRVVEGLLIGFEVRLEVGSLAELISTLSEGEGMEALPANAATVVVYGAHKMALAPPPPPARKYFPETLVWMPLLETNKQGKAKVEFKLADSITTWDIKVDGSNVQGQMGIGAQEVRAFLPLFVDHAPPRKLTVGDEIEMTATVRNYLDRPQAVRVSQELSGGLRAAGNAGAGQGTVAAGESVTFGFRVKATEAGKSGISRIRLAGERQGDAIERAVTIRPDGRRISVADSRVVSGETVFSLEIPDGKAEGRVRVYPSLLAHVFENYERFLETPHGCAEQTISSTYPNLLVLEFLGKAGVKDGPARAKALDNLRRGYERLLTFQAITGGFGYFGGAGMDEALTAYALEFLRRASPFVSVDSEAIRKAAEWVGGRHNDRHGGLARVLAVAGVVARHVPGERAKLEETMAWLDGQRGRMDVRERAELLRLMVALKQEGKARELAAELAGVLRRTEALEATAVGMTVFRVWGRPARLEAVAAAVQALEEAQATGVVDARGVIGPALEWLLARKGEHGTWYSSHTSVAVLSALLGAETRVGASGEVTIRVNGGAVRPVTFRDGYRAAEVDLGGLMKAGRNEVVVNGGGGGGYVSAAVRAAWYLPWTVADPVERPVSLRVSYNKTAVAVGETIECKVEARRKTVDGGGMMIAEVGLPPGVEVDRASLREMDSGRYEVEPDRVVLYLWPRGTEAVTARFQFRARFGMKAKAVASSLWDYYNPEARVEVAPEVFTVGGR